MVTRSKINKVLKNVIEDKKHLKIAGAAVAGVLILVIVLSIIFGSGGQNSYALYVKDREIFYTGLSGIKPWQVTEKFVDSEEIDDSDLADVASYLGMYTKVSSDGKNVFFFDKVTDEGGSLYYRRVNKSKKEPVKVDSNVTEYALNEKGNLVTYLKEEILYKYNMKESTEIVKEVEDFYMSKDGKNLVCISTDDEVYFKIGDKEKEEIDSDITRIVSVSEECDTVYYLKDDNLYKKEVGKDKVKIATDVYSVPKIYESGELYFLKEETQELNLSDYVEDDMKEEDANMTEPVESAYEDESQYQDAYYEFYEKEERDELRVQLEDGIMETSTYELFYYNGKKVESVAKGAASGIDVAADCAVAVYSVYDKGKVEKIKLSQVDYMFEIEDLVEEAMYSSSKCYAAVGKKSTEIKQTNGYDFEIDADGKTIYFIDNISGETNHGDLYKVKISGKKAKKPEKCDSKVYKYGAGFVSEGQYVYYKDVDDEGDSGKLYVNKKEVDSKVDLYNVVYVEETKSIIYVTEWNDNKEYGTLNTFKGNKATKIAEKVYSYSVMPNGETVYLSDFDTEECKGELYRFKGKKSKQIDTGVTAIIPVN